MSLLPSPGIVIDAVIVDVNQSVHKTGIARGLLRIEIGVAPLELHRVILAYSSHYGVLLNPDSYGKLSGRQSAYVPITLMFTEDEYQASLATPISALTQLISGNPLGGSNREPWVPAGPVVDQRGSDVKLAWALNNARFPVTQWTRQALSLSLPKRRPRPIQSVQFLIQGQMWTLVPPS